jgi:crotonobetainyl-CoA:carnitine CoA-transferase CaiB-like acyl-CoA transferase
MDALEGLTVLDFTSHIAGPYCTKLLADMGARVIKVEKPSGDSSRALPPFKDDRPGPDRGATYQYLNTNKESLVLNLKEPASRDVARRLAGMADLIVTGSSPNQEAALGVDYATLSGYKDVPVLSITNFGHEGPYRDYTLTDTVLYAMGAEMYSHGLLDREPLKLGGTAALLQGGAMAAVAAMGAVTAYELQGLGQFVEVPLFTVQISNIDRRSAAILAYRFSGRIQERSPGASAGIAGGIYPVADGYVELTASAGNYWRRFVDMIDDDKLRDPKWENPMFAMNPAAKEEADGIVYPWMLSHTRDEAWAAARKAHAMMAPLFDGLDVWRDENFRERGMWTEVEHPELGSLPMLGRPYIFEESPWRIRHAAPSLGQHTDTILGEAGYLASEISELRRKGVVA